MCEHRTYDANSWIHPFMKMWEGQSRQLGHTKKIDFKNPSEPFLSRILKRSYRTDPGIIEYQIDPTQFSYCGIDQVLSVCGI